MCGRVHRADPGALRTVLEAVFDEHGWRPPTLPETLAPAGEGFPTQPLPVLQATDTTPELHEMRWGIRPAWSKRDLINARQETLADKSTWSRAIRERRCTIPVAHFYEWRSEGTTKIRHSIGHSDGSLLFLAGLWSPSQEWGPCCAIITTAAGADVQPIHDRQPVILAPADLGRWLDPGIDALGLLQPLLAPSAAGSLEARRT